MTGSEFVIGAPVSCKDGDCGVLQRVVIDPVAKALTHLAVGPGAGASPGRLVPVELAEVNGPRIELRCTKAHFDALEDAQESKFVEGADGSWGYNQQAMLSLPFVGLSPGQASRAMENVAPAPSPHNVTYDHVPVGEVEVRRGQRVHAVDGEIGHIQGLVIDPADHHVTHVLLAEGHVWGKKDVAIPISAVTLVGDGVEVDMTKDQVRDLPSVELTR